MSSAANPGTPLPVRTPGSRARGRHRRPERPEIPAGAPALLIAVPATAEHASRQIAEELVSVVRGEQPGIDVCAGYLAVPEDAEGAEAEVPTIAELLAQAEAAELPAPVVVPLLAGPAGSLHAELEGALSSAGGKAPLTDVLGPHPLLAEAVHVRLSEAGLARADRARLFTINTTADGIVLATVGGEEAIQEAGAVTGVLLAARLAVPVIAAAVDVPGSIEAAAEQLRVAGSQRPALAPYLIGPEVPPGALEAAAESAGCPAAEPIGAYPGLARLVLGHYLGAIGVEMEQPAQAAPLG
jgi:hypothetical protein